MAKTGISMTSTISQTLLMQVNKAYLDIEKLYMSLATSLSSSAQSEMKSILQDLDAKLHNVRTLENDFAQYNKTQNIDSDALRALLDEKKDILERIQQANQELTQKAGSIKSLLQHDIKQMSKGRGVINSYKPFDHGKKHIIKKAF